MMSDTLKLYITAVIAAGTLVLGTSLWQWESADPRRSLVYLGLALLGSMLKVRLPGTKAMYSLGFLFILVGVLHFSLSETLVVGCAGALVQTLWNTRQRPTLVQTLFNVSTLIISIGLCFWLADGPFAHLWGDSGSTVLAVVACLFFIVNTALISGVLSLLSGKSLVEVSRQWYLWFFPYYLLGAVLVSLLPLSGQDLRPEAWLLLVPPLCLIHFYYGLSLDRHPDTRRNQSRRNRLLSPAARIYLGLVISVGLTLLSWGVLNWQSDQGVRFLTYLSVVVLASTLKVRLPGVKVNVSVNFVVLLAAVIELHLSEVMVLAATAGLVQCVWKPARQRRWLQIFTGLATLVTGASLAYVVCRHWLASTLAGSLPAMLVATTAVLYLSNSLMVSLASCLSGRKPLRNIWRQCCFWSFPYYLVGAAFAAVMVLTSQSVGWRQSFFVLPLMVLVYVSYRLHVDNAVPAIRKRPVAP